MSKLKALGSCSLVATLVCALILISTANAASPAETFAAISKPITLKYTCPWNIAGPSMVRRQAFCKQIDEKSGGKLKIELYGVDMLCASKQNFEAVQTGVADIAHIICSYTPGMFPHAQVLESPVIAPTITIAPENYGVLSYKVMTDLAPKVDPEVVRNGVIPSRQYWLGGIVHIYSKNPLRTVADFKNVKISCVSEVHSKCLQRLGFSPVFVPGAETYLALQKGVIDAALQTPGGAKLTKYEEVCKYVTELSWPQLAFTYAFNKKSYEKLPKGVQDFLMEEFRTWHEKSEIYGQRELEAIDAKFLADHGIQTIKLSAEETAKVRQALPSFDEWVAEQEKLGMKDAREFGQAALGLLNKYGVEFKQ